MAWQTPKTNWVTGDIPVANDFNRIEGNIQELQNTKETPAGAQAKANTALNSAKQYTDQEVGEVSQALTSHISVSASTSAKGHVQLINSVSSTSTTTAATPNSVKQAYDKANAALPKSGGTMTGILTAQSNTSYTVRQVRNMILSTADADVNAMQNGDVWIKYK